MVDGIDGRAHYLNLPAGPDLAELPLHGIVEARPPGQEKPVDRSIATVARGGLYKTADHLVQLTHANDRYPQSTVDAHVRRLEALRRAGIVERIADGVWKVPRDLLQKARAHDKQKNAGLVIELRSHLPIDQQVRAIGATWLDKRLVGDGSVLAGQGFGAQVRDAMRERVGFLATAESFQLNLDRTEGLIRHEQAKSARIMSACKSYRRLRNLPQFFIVKPA
ncbi:MAG TPA: DUF3363 domain-containing protein [Burkholderiaceae bacterium]|nr:DUF3363 domain-containing protein [Burkholderiaceae bacterium]